MYSYHKYLQDKGRESRQLQELAQHMKDTMKHQRTPQSTQSTRSSWQPATRAASSGTSRR